MDPLALGALAVSASVTLASFVRDISDGVTVGTRYGVPYRLPLNKHICILGPTRSGKSSLVRAMVNRLSRKYVVTVLDWHGEYSGLLTTVPVNAIRINLRGIPPKLLTEILGFGLNLNEPSMYLLYRIIRDGDYESLSDIIDKVNNYLVNTRAEAEMKAGILRRLEYVAGNLDGGVIDIKLLTRSDAVIDLSDLTIIEEKRLVMAFLLASLYVHYMREGIIRRGVSHVLVIEEAQNLVGNDSSGFTIVDHILMETGKYGVRAVLVSNAIPRTSLLKHCNIIMFKMKPDFLEGGVFLSEELIKKLSEITPEEALVITGEGIVRIRPLRSPPVRNHVIVRFTGTKTKQASEDQGVDRLMEVSTTVRDSGDHGGTRDLRAVGPQKPNGNGNGDLTDGNALLSRALGNAPGESLFSKQLADLEDEVAGLRDRINEIERILQADEKLIEKILDIDYKLKDK
ncbi:ATP-binding protein [Vulcanisaeta thermophila]|uniref:ATP-binding protein n=1 Tax=Vulcanisaeta thermophila TaxID=867917 RepID=UPI00085393A9|nr:DUF87 domain-containing protein [Vulcanisaeta thermophila]